MVVADRLPHQRPFPIDHVDCCVHQLRIKVVESFPPARDGGRHVVGEREGNAHRLDRVGCGAQILRGHGYNPGVKRCDLIVMFLQLHELLAAGSSPPGAEEHQNNVTLALVFAERDGFTARRRQVKIRYPLANFRGPRHR